MSLLIQIPVDIVGIAGLVGMLHLAEGLLVLLVGGNHTVPIYQSKYGGKSREEARGCAGKSAKSGRWPTERSGRIHRSSGIYRFWPVPICLLIAVTQGEVGAVTMPEWWPLLTSAEQQLGLSLGLKAGVEAGMSTAQSLGLLPLAVTLGYSDLSGQDCEVKRRRWINGCLILLYALALLGLCLLAGRIEAIKWAAALWMVAGHEAIVLKGHIKGAFSKNKLETHIH